MDNTQLKDTTIMWGALGFWGAFMIAGFIVGMVAPGAFTPIMTVIAVAMLIGLGAYLPTVDNKKNVKHYASRAVHQYMRAGDRAITPTPGFVFAYARAQ